MIGTLSGKKTEIDVVDEVLLRYRLFELKFENTSIVETTDVVET
jgi:hypothetical protein